MPRKLNTILLVDDDEEDNYFHSIVINKLNIVNQIDVANNGLEALSYLKDRKNSLPDVIFLDLNMPKMNGWEFLEEYKVLSPEQKAKVLIVILTTSANPDDIRRAKEMEEVSGFSTKPLSAEFLDKLIADHFES